MKVILISVIFLSTCLVTYTADPIPPQRWPGNWYTWVVTSVTKVGTDKPLYVVGQLIAYDTATQYACRTNQQDLLTPTLRRPVDMCDYGAGTHYMLDDATPTSDCTGITPIMGPLGQIVWPSEYLEAAKFFGVDKVAQKDCNHFVAMGITIGTQLIQMDVWTAVDNDYPCQISITDIPTRVITTWAFDGFGTVIPPEAVNQCGAPKILCTQADWVCVSIPGTDPTKLLSALQWVCNPANLDCSPIQPGGEHYYPNTLPDHCNWAFNAYFLRHRASQGRAACNFGGTAQFIPPNNTTVGITQHSVPFTDVFSKDIICDRN